MEKLFWLKDGDLNTKYFHFVASTRNDICNVAKSYFQILFIIIIIIIIPLLSIMMLLTMLIVAFLMMIMNFFLNLFFTDDLRQTLFQMNSDKSPDPDDLNLAFYKCFWNLCGLEIFSAATTWLNIDTLPPKLSNTSIVLIPKNTSPYFMKDFRLISLCNPCKPSQTLTS